MIRRLPDVSVARRGFSGGWQNSRVVEDAVEFGSTPDSVFCSDAPHPRASPTPPPPPRAVVIVVFRMVQGTRGSTLYSHSVQPTETSRHFCLGLQRACDVRVHSTPLFLYFVELDTSLMLEHKFPLSGP